MFLRFFFKKLAYQSLLFLLIIYISTRVSAVKFLGQLLSKSSSSLTDDILTATLQSSSKSENAHMSLLSRPNILLTGGAGYIGTHTIVCLLESGYDVTVIDNLINSNEESIRRVQRITQCDPSRLTFHKVDLCDASALESIFASSPKFSACIHFAGLKAVGESVQKPLLYYRNNLDSTMNLLEMMDKYGCKSIVFSSSATVYGQADEVPLTENSKVGEGITNPYGRTKYMIEEILKDFKKSKDMTDTQSDEDRWSVVILRYFNPVGAHPSGLIGEDPNGIPNNLMPFVAQVAVGRRPKVMVFGNDYDTPDGTGVRDYIHVMDLAEGHVAAIKFAESRSPMSADANVKVAAAGYGEYSVFNLGTGRGNSVLEMVAAMEKASGNQIVYEITGRREGDIATCYANTDKAEQQLGWKASRTLDDMCGDLWTWQSQNPRGYNDA